MLPLACFPHIFREKFDEWRLGYVTTLAPGLSCFNGIRLQYSETKAPV